MIHNYNNSGNLRDSIKTLFDTVVDGGYCIGCGACASFEDSPIKIKLDKYKKLQAFKEQDYEGDHINTSSVLSVCPFSDESENEDSIGKRLYGSENIKNDKLGYIKETYAGYVKEGEYRINGSSGGMGTWILTELFTKGLIDNVVHVGENIPSEEDSRLFKYKISSSLDDIFKGAKSRYYPVELSEVVREIRNKPGRYAMVGLPCFIKAIRLLMRNDKILEQRICYTIGLVCGQLKSGYFAGMWSWQVGIHPHNLKGINFRTKIEGYGSNSYGITATGLIDGELVTRVSPPVSKMFGYDWGWGPLKYKACDYCDDVVAETADVTIGDAWLPQYVKDGKGTNIIIVRSSEIKNLITNALNEDRIYLDSITQEQAIESQKSGFVHRREGLSYRLSLAESKHKWYPTKRVEVTKKLLSSKVRKRMDTRLDLAEKSHDAFQKALSQNSFQVFTEELKPLLDVYKDLYKKSLYTKVKNKLKNIIIRFC